MKTQSISPRFMQFRHYLHSRYKRYLAYLLIILGVLISLLFVVDRGMAFYVRDRIYTDVEKLPYRPYALVLGTAKYVETNRINLFYQHRLQATYDLFNQKKVDYILLSGDNRTVQYNEPRTMLKDLRKMGIPNEVLYMDFAGFRTLDSIIRADKIFKATPLTIITQQFHCERALFIAKSYNIDAICFAAETPDSYKKVRIREFLARLNALWDIWIQKAPYFLGEPEPLPQSVELPTE